MPVATIAAFCFILLAANRLRAQGAPISEGYDHFYNLEYEDAIRTFTAEADQTPDNPNAWNHLAHAILYRAMFRSGALESELVTGSNPFLHRDKVKITDAEHEQFDRAISKAMQLSQSRLLEQPDDPRSLGALGVSYGLRTNYNFLVRKAWTDALHDATDARKAHRRLCELEPDNIDARMIPGVYDYVAGSLSLGYRILGFMAGYHGDRNRGIDALETVAREGASNRADAEVMLIAIYRRERRPKASLALLDDLVQRFPRNYLLRFEKVQMYADAGDEAAALEEVTLIRKLHGDSAPGFAELAPEKIDYLEGNLLFWYNDLDRALADMRKVTSRASELDLNTSVMSWMRLGQINDLDHRRTQALTAYRKAIAGAPQSEVAKECRSYVAKPYKRQENIHPRDGSVPDPPQEQTK
jgi:tetratricopeptide (TPR) repeat protein